jgi:hypothetical protein
MIRVGAALAVLCAVTQAVAGQPARGHAFDGGRGDALPAGFEFAAMRQETSGRWLVRREGGNGALVHAADAAARGFALALAPDAPLLDVEASVRMRLAAGTRRGGLVWRYTDPTRYYAALLDLGDGRLSLFRVVEGNRTFLESEDGLELDPAAWHTLKIVHADARIVVSLGGIRVFEERDRRYTAAVPGRTGVIAAGDAEAWFDDLRLEPARLRRR